MYPPARQTVHKISQTRPIIFFFDYPTVISVVLLPRQSLEIAVTLFSRKYIPVLKKYPPKYIYEPWTAPLGMQRAAGCVIGKDYPKPIIDHKEAVKTNITRMKKARANHYGDAADQGTSFCTSKR